MMSLIRWDPFRSLEQMTEQLNRLAAESRADGEDVAVADWVPAVDIVETDDEYQIDAELPEVAADQVKVWLDDKVLRLEGERPRRKEEHGGRFHRAERSCGRFARAFILPADVDDRKLTAEFKDGVLRVRLPKAEKTKPRSIEVRQAA